MRVTSLARATAIILSPAPGETVSVVNHQSGNTRTKDAAITEGIHHGGLPMIIQAMERPIPSKKDRIPPKTIKGYNLGDKAI